MICRISTSDQIDTVKLQSLVQSVNLQFKLKITILVGAGLSSGGNFKVSLPRLYFTCLVVPGAWT